MPRPTEGTVAPQPGFKSSHTRSPAGGCGGPQAPCEGISWPRRSSRSQLIPSFHRKPSHETRAPTALPGHFRAPKVTWLERAHKKQQLSVKDDFHTSHSLGARPLGALRGGSVMSAKTHPSRKRCCHIRHVDSNYPTYLMRWASRWATTWYDWED